MNEVNTCRICFNFRLEMAQNLSEIANISVGEVLVYKVEPEMTENRCFNATLGITGVNGTYTESIVIGLTQFVCCWIFKCSMINISFQKYTSKNNGIQTCGKQTHLHVMGAWWIQFEVSHSLALSLLGSVVPMELMFMLHSNLKVQHSNIICSYFSSYWLVVWCPLYHFYCWWSWYAAKLM